MENGFMDREKKKETGKEIKEWSRSILLAVVIAVIIRLFFLEVFLVEGSSMEPTLDHQERLIVNKVVYLVREPEVGEIVVFNYSPKRDFIKRIIAEEGDTVEIEDDSLYVNDTPVEEPYLDKGITISDFGPVTIPEGYFFVLGDNRSNSMDSRDPSVGPVSQEDIKGRAELVFWPVNQARLLDP